MQEVGGRRGKGLQSSGEREEPAEGPQQCPQDHRGEGGRSVAPEGTAQDQLKYRHLCQPAHQGDKILNAQAFHRSQEQDQHRASQARSRQIRTENRGKGDCLRQVS